MMAVLALAPQGDGSEEPGETARAIVARGYQTELPDREFPFETSEPAAAVGGKGDRANSRGRNRSESDRAGGRGLSPRSAGEVGGAPFDSSILFWVVVGIGVAVALAMALGSARGHRCDFAVADDAEAAPPLPGAVRLPANLVEEADRLAGQARYAEAIHLLWLRVVEALQIAGVLHDRPSWTGREIASRADLPAPDLSALRALMQSVERGLFARREIVRADYEDSVREYRRLVAITGGGGI